MPPNTLQQLAEERGTGSHARGRCHRHATRTPCRTPPQRHQTTPAPTTQLHMLGPLFPGLPSQAEAHKNQAPVETVNTPKRASEKDHAKKMTPSQGLHFPALTPISSKLHGSQAQSSVISSSCNSQNCLLQVCCALFV